MKTFGTAARYDEEPWNDHHIGRDAVRAYYESLLRAMPDLRIDVRQRLPSFWRPSSAAITSGLGAACHQPGARSDFHCVEFLHSIIRIG